MSRTILLACWPCLLAMLFAFGALAILVRLSGARWNLPQLRKLHVCEEGSTQTVSFVLTLPVFIMVVLFIIQMSQLMIGTSVVHYAAFAAARAASVWVPANLISELNTPRDGEERTMNDSANKIHNFAISDLTSPMPINEVSGRSNKLRKIWLAAVNACAAASPSERHYQDVSDQLDNPQLATLFQNMAPASQRNPKTAARLRNKLSYSARNTFLTLSRVEKDTATGPTYNPNEPLPRAAPPDGYEHVPHNNEIGWDDPITITVHHQFALLPGPGRLLATRLARRDGGSDNVSNRILVLGDESKSGKFYGTHLSASVTLTPEGLRSVIPYVEHEE